MSVRETWRRLFLGAVFGVLLVASLPAWAGDAADDLNYAQQLIDMKDHGGAIKVLLPLISSPEPTAQEAKKKLALCYKCCAQYGKAIPLYESILRDYPHDATSLSTLQSHLGVCLSKSGEFDRIVAALKRGPGDTPLPPGTNRMRGERLWCCYVNTEDWGNGVPFFNSLVEKWPQDAAEWHLQSARCNRRMGFRAEAIASLEKAMELSKSDIESIKRIEPELTGAYKDSGQPEKAEKLIQKLRIEHPGYDEYMRQREAAVRDREATRCANKGYRLQDSGEYEKAIATFKVLIAGYPECKKQVGSAHVCIVECLQSLGKSGEAMAYAKKLYDEHTDMRAPALLGQGIVSAFSKPEQAVVYLQRVLAEYPDYSGAVVAKSFLVSALQKTGRTDEAVALLTQSISWEIGPVNKVAALLRICDIYSEAERHRDALKVLKEVRDSKDPTAEQKAEATYRSGLCYRAMKYYGSARTCMDRVVTLYPDSQWAKQARGALHVWANSAKQSEAR